MEQKVRKGDELNEINLKKFLKENNLISELKSDLGVLQFSNGFSNLTYKLNIEDKEYVIRKPPKGAVYGHDMGREYKVLKGLNNGFNKAPKVYAFSNDNNIIGTPFYIMEKVNGRIITPRELKEKTIALKSDSSISRLSGVCFCPCLVGVPADDGFAFAFDVASSLSAKKHAWIKPIFASRSASCCRAVVIIEVNARSFRSPAVSSSSHRVTSAEAEVASVSCAARSSPSWPTS